MGHGDADQAPRGTVDAGGRQQPTAVQVESAATTFALLGSPTRLRLAWLMTREVVDVGTLADRVGLSLATTSQHLAKLRLGGIASARREGKHTFYTIDDPHVVELIEQVFDHIAPDGSLAPDPTPGIRGRRS